MSIPGNNIRQLRMARDWTQEDLAERMNVTNVTISRWESGARVFSSKDLRALATIFKVTPQDVMGDGAIPAAPQPSGRPRKVPDPKFAEAASQGTLIATLLGGKEASRVALDERLLGDLPKAPESRIALFQLRDDSMAPFLGVGDMVFIDTHVSQITRDGVYALKLAKQDIPTIRRVSISPADGKLRISCDNASYQPFVDVAPEAIPVIGRVVRRICAV
ncbi:hypothetical protein AYJ57_20620 (plasmid) [Salipiger sp. CCB-MM3]|uniref:XRE family transcriptional regulator n=1 Tax=Salipiger sp. CCB-MM3 TaxID=1792508 RepID=UPI00080AA6CB|nr:helix-turn-helix domain-containing protein [Salipiger sp. CCB-MM3]ANT62892.1 hypothetical protein AYJ57_20620 [Salipiger sp. CCB-MM3]